MDEPRSLSMPLSMRLRQWAVHHLDYPGPPISASPGSESGSTSSHEEAWSEICVGSLSQQWRYLLEHVRSKPQVHHIRGNLILEHHRQKLQQNRPSDLTLLPVIETTLASEFKPELEDERTHLLAEYKDLTRRIQKSTLRMTQNETRIRQYRRDVRWQTDLTRKTEMELHERRKSAQLLQKFAAQARGEVSRLSAWAKDLRDLARDESERSIFRSHLPEERLFAHDGKELKTSAQHAVNQAPNNPAGLIYQESADLWKQWLVGEPIAEYKANGGFYQVGPDAQQHLPFKLIALNTNIYKLKNHFTEGIQDPLGQFEWLESLLKKAESDQTKVILFAHIPPGKFERFYQYMEEEDHYGFHWFTPTFNQKYLELLDKYSHVISAQFYGHHHTDALKMISANNGTPTSFGLLAPAVTPWISTLAPETGGNNPGLRLFKYDMDTGEILDYDQFWLNLAKANADNVPEWKLEYSFLEYYGLQGTIDLNLMLELTTKIRDDVQTFERYYSANSVQFDTDCDQTCRRYHLCAIFEQDYSQFEDCVSNSSRNLSSNTSTYIFLFFLYTLPNCRQWT